MQNYFEAPKSTLIYVFRINDPVHSDCLKVGETSLNADEDINIFTLQPNASILNKAARRRIDQYTKTAGINYELLYTESAVYLHGKGIGWFNDKAVHEVLLRSGIKRKAFEGDAGQGTEWFITDLETVKRAIKAVKEGRKSLSSDEVTKQQSPIVFRPEQREAIDKTLKHFKKGSQMLWNAKMRFGKTLSALQVVRESGFVRTLILTHRPVVNEGWFEDFHKIFYDSPDYNYGSKEKGETYSELEKGVEKQGRKYVYFASMQDLRGSETVGGKFDKNNDVFNTPWDLIIVDEAHEGTQTPLGQAVMKELVKDKTKVLSLSGTPFNLLDEYKEDEIFTWDYVMEQRAKQEWDTNHYGDPNPYAGLPKLNIYTYDLGRLLKDFVDEDIAFNFREFFRVGNDEEFIHKNDVWSFLNLLTKEDKDSMYPFANEWYRSIFRHTLWVVPGVKEAKALSAMLKNHPVFQYFTIVNVAGDGDEDEGNKDALEMVNNAIGRNPDETHTITLSCTRLRTGVSVKAWMGVLMLTGNIKTDAKPYMQTIFRVQTPATINGRVKEDCYVFDFAPDRTLQVLATVPKVATKAGKTTENQKKALGEFLNFCPVISIEGSKMESINVTRMLQQLKKAYIERVVRNGFDDNCLYNDKLLTDVKLKEFEQLKGIIGQTKAMEKTGDIDINAQGLTNEEYEEKEKLEKKKKKDLTEEEKRRLEELKKKKKNKEYAISILRSLSIRMPLLIYGADIKDEDTELTIDNFTSLVDPQSWEEFMPRGVTKQKFNAFKKYYDPEIFSAAGKRIRAMARAADKLTVEERIGRIASIFNTFRNPDKETVLTPWRVVNMHMGDCLGGFCFFNEDYSEELEEPRYIDHGKVTNEVFATDSHLLEINSKSGLYPLYLAYNVYRRRLNEEMLSPETLEQHQALWDKTVAENIFVICKTPMAKAITKRTLMGFRTGRTNMWAPEDLINKIKNQPDLFIKKVHDLIGKNMKINAIVGNPPYQEENGNTRKPPIYHLFYDIAFRLSDKVSLITPGRFLFRAGQTPKEWMDKILNDEHFKVVDYFQKSTDVFPSVDIKGGVVITYRNAQQIFGKIGFFSNFPQLSSILKKVYNDNTFIKGEFANIVSSRGMYRFDNLFFLEHPEACEALKKGTGNMITSNSFDLYKNVFTTLKPTDETEYIQIFGRSENKREYKWVKRAYIIPNDYLEYYNVLVPEANGTGAIGEVLSTPMIGHTDTFLSIGKFDNETEAENCLKYIRSKFARTMLGTLKATQHNPASTWANVPLQDFTSNSDIDWNKSISEIDQQLYAKYNLSKEEVAFIERMIKPM